MKLAKNLRSGYIQEDVEDYLYALLPERDAVLSEMEEYAAENKVPIIGPAVARMMSLLVQISGAKRIFELGSAIGYSTIWLARAAGPQSRNDVHGWRTGKCQTCDGLFQARGRGETNSHTNGRRPGIVEEDPG